jgi:hypothetical protein
MSAKSPPELLRFLGVSLSGGKTEKTATVQLDFYPKQNRLFVSELNSKILFKSGLSADEILIQWILKRKDSESLTFDVPITLPSCFDCQCQNKFGPEYCPRPEVQWLIEQSSQKGQRPLKPVTPYTQRALDFFLSESEGLKFEVGHALGSNLAPLTARARFLIHRISIPVYETQPKVSSFVLGLNFNLAKSKLHGLYLSSQGEEARALFIKHMIERTGIFIYKQDLKYLSENYHAFNALISAFMGYLKYQNLVVTLPEILSFERCLLPKAW